jgi:DNA helicase II / ATP-dependent DNA helicase PcrA
MAEFVPSPQQETAIEEYKTGEGNFFVKSGAGTGKTTLCLESFAAVDEPTLYAVFGKKNQLEAAEKIAARGLRHVACGTYHSIGRNGWRQVAPYAKIEKQKKWDYLLKPWDPAYHAFIRKAVEQAKNRCLGVFGEICDETQWLAIADHFNLYEELTERENIEKAIQLSIKTLEESNEIGREIIDFDDMIYLPILYGVKMHQFPRIMGDEQQDANQARRSLARKILADGGRVGFVGDPNQAIMGFAGADNDSCDRTIADFGCKVLSLNVTYRCPKAIVTAAQRYVQDYFAHESAPEGEFFEEEDGERVWAEQSFNPTDAILCRNTKPLIEQAYSFIRRGIACHVEGRDIGAGLIAFMDKWRVATTDAFLNKLEVWETRQVERALAKGDEMEMERIRDKAATLRILCEGCVMLADVKRKIESLFQDSNGKPADNITLSTIHKAKGLEWPNVYVYGYKELMPSKYARKSWEMEQERHLGYVAFTRAKERLVLVG